MKKPHTKHNIRMPDGVCVCVWERQIKKSYQKWRTRKWEWARNIKWKMIDSESTKNEQKNQFWTFWKWYWTVLVVYLVCVCVWWIRWQQQQQNKMNNLNNKNRCEINWFFLLLIFVVLREKKRIFFWIRMEMK